VVGLVPKLPLSDCNNVREMQTQLVGTRQRGGWNSETKRLGGFRLTANSVARQVIVMIVQ